MFPFSYINCTVPHDRNYMLFVSLRTVSSKFLGFSQKPPNGSIPTARRHISDESCSCFGLNRLATRNSCQAARHRSRSLLMFVAILASAYVFSVVDVRGFYWIPSWIEMDYQIAE